MDRVPWVDNVKTLAIFLVILGHFRGLDPTVKSLIYSFHIPVFLFITGFLLTSRINAVSFSDFLKKHVLPYTVVYLLFSAAAILFYVLNNIGDDMLSTIFKTIWGTLYGVHGSERALIHGNGPLWYFPFFLTTLVIMYFIVRLPTWLRWAAALSYCAFSFLYSGIRLPWCLDIAGIGVLFCLIGYSFRIHYDVFKGVVESRWSLLLLPFLATMLIFLVGVNGTTNVNKVMFGANGFIYIINAVIGGLCLLIAAFNLPATKLSQNISMSTLTIFCCHIYLVKAFRTFPYPDDGVTKLFLMSYFAIVILMICLLFSVKFDPLLKRYILRR